MTKPVAGHHRIIARFKERCFEMEQSVTVAADKHNADKQDNGMQLVQHRRVKSETLFVGAGELVIEHAGREYRLRITSKGKLILTA